jgi:hypothetical protein
MNHRNRAEFQIDCASVNGTQVPVTAPRFHIPPFALAVRIPSKRMLMLDIRADVPTSPVSVEGVMNVGADGDPLKGSGVGRQRALIGVRAYARRQQATA